MRLFVAVELSETVRGRLGAIQSRLRHRCSGVRWVRAELIHLTLKFLGEVGDDMVPAISDSVASVAAASAPFNMRVGGLGCFPKQGSVRVVWAGVDVPTGQLNACVDTLESAMEQLGFPRERRPFSPHLTLGRVRDDRTGGALRKAIAAAELSPCLQRVESMVLMSSVLSPKGPSYSAVSTVRLKMEA